MQGLFSLQHAIAPSATTTYLFDQPERAELAYFMHTHGFGHGRQEALHADGLHNPARNSLQACVMLVPCICRKQGVMSVYLAKVGEWEAALRALDMLQATPARASKKGGRCVPVDASYALRGYPMVGSQAVGSGQGGQLLYQVMRLFIKALFVHQRMACIAHAARQKERGRKRLAASSCASGIAD